MVCSVDLTDDCGGAAEMSEQCQQGALSSGGEALTFGLETGALKTL